MSYTWLLFFELHSGVINDDPCHRIEPLELFVCPALIEPIDAVCASSYARSQMRRGRLSVLRVTQQQGVQCDSLRSAICRWLFGHAKV